MKNVTHYFIAWFFRFMLWFRYRIKVRGLENLNEKNLSKPGGVLFLPNHPAVFVDPAIVTLAAFPKFKIRPIIVEYMYYMPIVNWVMRKLDAVPVPDFDSSSNSIKKKRNEKVVSGMIEDLRQGSNFLIYPAGRTKSTSFEAIGGASAVHKIVNECPEANVVLVRIKGLWGSSFSRAFTGFAPPLFPTLKSGIKAVFKNLIFFTPRREVIVEFYPAPKDFPYKTTRLEFNKYLESWYNKPDGLSKQNGEFPGDSFVLVSFSMWGEKYPEMTREQKVEEDISLTNVPPSIQDKITKKLSEMTKIPQENIKPDMDLASGLGLDSLDTAEITVFLQDEFEVQNLPITELTTVKKLMALASKQIVIKEEVVKEVDISEKWKREPSYKRAYISDGKIIPEVFLNTCKKMGKIPACGDERSGVLTYPQLKLRVLLLADYIKTLPGEYIGILLPSSVGAMILTLATQLAGKVPLMINWTVGPRHLESVIQLSNVQKVLTAWSFIDRLENVELTGLENRLVMLEDLAPSLTLRKKLKALYRSKLSTKKILKLFGLKQPNEDAKAVLLFTSGTESMPKGVPLSHKNILVNQRDALNTIELMQDDILLSILPPFHAFGFTASGLLGLLSGFRIAYSPDPTDGKKLAKSVKRWDVNIFCSAPTFLKNMIKMAQPGDLDNLRLIVTGAEKTPAELFDMVEKLGKKENLIEGYGITECSPFLSANIPGKLAKGVGFPFPSVEICIIHQETEKVLGKNEQGLVLARGPNVFSGYLNEGISSPFMEVDGKQWYKTGDLGYLDDEGRLVLSGRMKRFVKVGGEMVSLASIEDALLQAARKKGWPTDEEGPSLAICAKEKEGEKTEIYLFTKFATSVSEVNYALKEAGFSNLVRISSCIQLPEIPLMGSGKINYRLLETQFLNSENLAQSTKVTS
ncbi:Bifunctional protein aas [Candidatus Rubidus massiliensis]|nr:Bifunctional protein aas [Candidatus Rubidus massiliensis]